MVRQVANVEVQRCGCAALCDIAACNVACERTAMSAGGVEEVVAAMARHPAEAVLRCGCAALRNIAADDAACDQAVLGAGGVWRL